MLKAFMLFGWMTGFEPATSGTTNQRSNQLSYSRHDKPAGRRGIDEGGASGKPEVPPASP